MKRKTSILTYASIISLFICTGGGTLENSALQTMIEAWPDVSTSMIRMLTTLPSFISMFVMIIVGKIVGKKLPYKTSVLTGTLLIAVGGIVPFFIHPSWIMILVFRAVIGVGIGFAALGNALMMRTAPAESLARLIGYGGIISSLGGVVMNFIVGNLTKMGWNYAFLANIEYLIPFVLCLFFLREPEKIESPKEKVKKEPIPKAVYVFIAMQFVSTMVLYPLLSGISSYLSSVGISDTAIAGTMLSIYTGGGMVGNFLLPYIKKALGKNTLIFAYGLVVVGVALVITVHQVVVIGAGIFLSGMGFITLMSGYQVYNGLICTPGQMASASTMVLAANQLGVFLSTFFIELTGNIGVFDNEITNTLLVCLIAYVIMTVIILLSRHKLLEGAEE